MIHQTRLICHQRVIKALLYADWFRVRSVEWAALPWHVAFVRIGCRRSTAWRARFTMLPIQAAIPKLHPNTAEHRHLAFGQPQSVLEKNWIGHIKYAFDRVVLKTLVELLKVKLV
ncbi:MAG TPA: hypothetical protein VF278_06980, partial [Pirellulales bacterium]